MSNFPSPIDFDLTLAQFLTLSVSDGTYADVIDVLKVDEAGKEVTATGTKDAGGQIWANLQDDMFEAVYTALSRAGKVWKVATGLDFFGLGSDDGLAVGDIGVALDSISTLAQCVSVDGPAASTWTPVGLQDAPSDGTTYGRKDGAWAAVSSGGGGGFLTLALDNPPLIPSAFDDEFPGPGLDVKWTTFDPDGDFSEAPSVDPNLGLKLVYQGATKTLGVYQAAPAGDFTAYAYVNTMSFTNGFHGIGILAAKDIVTNPNTANFAGGFLAGIPADQAQYMYAGNIANRTTGIASFQSTIETHGWIWIRLRHDSAANDVFVDYSIDGLNWIELFSNLAFGAVDYFGIFVHDTLNFLDIQSYCKSFRVDIGNSDFYAVVPNSIPGA